MAHTVHVCNNVIYCVCVVCSPFWDIVVITGGDEEQARSYELQLNEKLSNKEIPLCTKYVLAVVIQHVILAFSINAS